MGMSELVGGLRCPPPQTAIRTFTEAVFIKDKSLGITHRTINKRTVQSVVAYSHSGMFRSEKINKH